MLKVCVYIKLSIFGGSFAAAGKWEQTVHNNCISFLYYRTLVANSSLWFLREHQSECADYGVDAYSAACLKSSPYAVPCARPGGFPSSQVILPLAPTIELEEFLEVVRIEGHAFSLEDVALACDMYLLQVKLSASCAQLVFAPIHELFADDALLVPSSFHVSPLDPKSDGPTSRTLAAMAL
ncbi:Homeobox-leucine zipper family protein / lipid-binding START domain-containing protein [Trifolium repens]|nr:Homeobox-leucine zipper family protein / lipid-binding START domain-containing protein [Trifolium repens]